MVLTNTTIPAKFLFAVDIGLIAEFGRAVEIGFWADVGRPLALVSKGFFHGYSATQHIPFYVNLIIPTTHSDFIQE